MKDYTTVTRGEKQGWEFEGGIPDSMGLYHKIQSKK